jgi:hypothetical protein
MLDKMQPNGAMQPRLRGVAGCTGRLQNSVHSYTGPVSVGTDDTSIEKALQAYLAVDGSWQVVGGCAGPIVACPPQVPGVPLEQGVNDFNILDILRDKDTICADKVRVVILTIPVPKVSPAC